MDIREISTIPDSGLLVDVINYLPAYLIQIVGKINIDDDGKYVIERLRQNDLLGASDGSVIEKDTKATGAHAYTIGGYNSDKGKITGASNTPRSTIITSLTTELYGLIAFTTVMYCIAKKYKIHEDERVQMNVYCDNEQAVKMASNKEPPINISETLAAEYDLQQLIHHIGEKTPIDINYKWIKSHQDTLKTTGEKIYGPFSREVQLNLEVDHLAHTTAQQSTDTITKRAIYPSSVMGAYNDKGKYISNIYDQLLHNKNYETLWEYMKSKYEWDEEAMQNIEWSSLNAALSKYIPTYKTKIIQLMYDWQAIGERKELMNEEGVNCLMQCGCKETKMHYLWCRDPEFTFKRQVHLNLLQKQLRAIYTYPGTVATFSKILTVGFDDEWINNLPTIQHIDKLLIEAIQHQRRLGAGSIAKGYLVKQWLSVHYEWGVSTATNSYTPSQWAKRTIEAVHLYTFLTWKERNDILHKDKVKSKTAVKRLNLQQRIDTLYRRVRANLTQKEKKYFYLLVEQRQRKGIDHMTLWIQIVEAIFRKRGRARQEKIDSWLTGSTPSRNWKDKFKKGNRNNNSRKQEGLGGRVPDPG